MITVPYEVKKALRDGMLRKNYRFVVLNDDGTEDFTIDNDTLVSESVNIDERMCSGDTLKFGLCEGSSLEFQYFDHPNITGRRVQVFVDVEYEKVITEYVWETQARFNNYYTISDMSGDCRLYSERSNAWEFVYVSENGETTQVTPTPSESGTIIELGDVTGRTLMVNLDVMPAPSAQLQLLIPHTGPQILTYSIPMGFFDVKKCSRQASTGIMKVTAYNKLQSEYLDAKANDYIEELLAQGEDDLDSVSLYKLLSDLLGGYGIEEYDESEKTIDMFNERSFDVGTTRMCDEYGTESSHYYAAYCYNFILTTDTWSQADYYRCTLFLAYIRDYIENLYYAERYTKVNGQVMSLGDYAASAFTNARFFGGQVNRSKDYTWTPVVNRLISSDAVVNTDYHTNMRYGFQFYLPIFITTSASSSPTVTDNNKTFMRSKFNEIVQEAGTLGIVYKRELSEMEQYRLTEASFATTGDVTLRELQSAVYEVNCQFGQLSRTTDLFSGVDLNYGGLYPADTLYPANDLYPGGAVMSANKAMYSQLWADEGNVHKWRYLIITYKGLDENNNEVDIVHQRTIDANGTDDYNMSDNWLFKNLIWTEEQIDDYADAMIAKMQNHEWFPFEMWLAGLPYLETGDQIEIPLNGEVYTSYVLQRQLKGIQNLQDTYINGTLDIF